MACALGTAVSEQDTSDTIGLSRRRTRDGYIGEKPRYVFSFRTSRAHTSRIRRRLRVVLRYDAKRATAQRFLESMGKTILARTRVGTYQTRAYCCIYGNVTGRVRTGGRAQ